MDVLLSQILAVNKIILVTKENSSFKLSLSHFVELRRIIRSNRFSFEKVRKKEARNFELASQIYTRDLLHTEILV